MKLKININKLTQSQKILCLISLLSLVLIFVFSVSSYARYKNRNGAVDIPEWDGSIAQSYKSGNGSENNPYIISNAAELAYFAQELKKTDYENTYFELSNHIKINQGIFNYNAEDGIEYTLKNKKYYIKEYTDEYYTSPTMDEEKGKINIFPSLENFKGIFNGKFYTIYGLYITDKDKQELSLFNNLKGNVKNLYIENSLIYGGSITAGVTSVANNANIKNVLFGGTVISKNLKESTVSNEIVPDLINLETNETIEFINLNNNFPLIGKEIISTKITGKYTLNNTTEENSEIVINGISISEGSFDIELGNEIVYGVIVEFRSNDLTATLDFTELKYEITYTESVTSGIVGVSNNSVIENVINKSSVYGNFISSGIVGVTNSKLEVKNSYNNGKIISNNFSSGLISVIDKSNETINIINSYNTGEILSPLNSGIISIINENIGEVKLDNVFNTTSNNLVGEIYLSDVILNNSYYTDGIPVGFGITTGDFMLTTIEDLKTKEFGKETLLYNEFISFEDVEENSENVWVYNIESLPMLYIDDASNPIAKLHASIYSWDNYSTHIITKTFNKNITFTVEENELLDKIENIYYLISNSSIILTKAELGESEEWIPYESVTKITDQGNYIIYIKIVDINNNITYINSDVLILDLDNSPVNIHMDEIKWSKYEAEPSYLYLDEKKELRVDVNLNAEIEDILYYITDLALDILGLNQLNEENWIEYNGNIQIDQIGTNIVYLKTIDKDNNVIYYNTDYLVYDGYSIDKAYIGKNYSSYEDEELNITGKSNLTFNIKFNNSSLEYENYTHNLVSNIVLPMGTKIIIRDNITNKIYQFKVNTEDGFGFNESCDEEEICEKVATYPLTLFKEVGSINKNYIENSYYDEGNVNEDYEINIDFSNTNILTNYENVKLYMELRDNFNEVIRPTLKETIKTYNIYSDINDVNADLFISTDYDSEEIKINLESSTDVNLNLGINYKVINDVKIIDTSFEDKKLGIAIKLVDNDDEIISKDHLKTTYFKFQDNLYYPDKDGIVRIVADNINDLNSTLTIITSDHKSKLVEGNYYLKIFSYTSYNGKAFNEQSRNMISLPVKVNKKVLGSEYNLDINLGENPIFKKVVEENIKMPINITLDETLNNPYILVSLYEKEQLVEYNQNYTILNISEYIEEELTGHSENVYVLPNNIEELNLLSDNFNKSGYKLLFKIYDGDKLIATIEKYFIIK